MKSQLQNAVNFFAFCNKTYTFWDENDTKTDFYVKQKAHFVTIWDENVHEWDLGGFFWGGERIVVSFFGWRWSRIIKI